MTSEYVGDVCIDVMLWNGVPDCNVFDGVLSSLDKLLEENDVRLEQCLKDLTKSVLNETSNSVDSLEALKQFSSEIFLTQSSCVTLQCEKILQLINFWTKTLESIPDGELTVMQAICHLSSVEGIALPMCQTAAELSATEPVSSLDSEELRVTSAWNQLCWEIHRRVFRQIETIPIGSRNEYVSQLLSGLRVIFPPSLIASQYQSLRLKQLDFHVEQHQLRFSSGIKMQSFQMLVPRFCEFMSRVLVMMSDDFEFFVSGTFDENDFEKSFDCLGEIYFDRLRDEIKAVIERLQSELSTSPSSSSDAHYKRGSKSSAKNEDRVAMSKSPSDIGFLERHLNALSSRRNRSQSADDVIEGTAARMSTHLAEKSRDQRFDSNRFEAFVSLISCLLGIDEHLESWLSSVSSSWHNVVDVRRESKPRSYLKSAMKGHKQKEKLNPSCEVAQGSTKNLSDLSNIDIDSVPLLKDSSLSDRMHLDWRTLLVSLSPDVSRELTNSLCSLVRSALRDDPLQEDGSLHSAPVAGDAIEFCCDGPKLVSMSSWCVYTELCRLLPLGKAGKEPPLSSLRMSYVDAMSSSLELVAQWCNVLSTEQLEKVSVQGLYVVLSTTSFWPDQIVHFGTELALDESSKKCLESVSQKFKQLSHRLICHIIQRHSCLLVTSLLCDAESHNWSDKKEFCEDKLCSFDIQAWNLYMKHMQADLRSCCSQKDSKSVVTGVLKESLSHFAWRYTHIEPSRQRISQLIADITVILLCTSDLLMAACDSITTYVDPRQSDGDTFLIHSYCCTLLSALAILGSPLDVLYRVYRKGFGRKSLANAETHKAYMSQWLYWIQPNLLQFGKVSYDDVQTNTVMYIQLHMFAYHRSYHLLLQALVMREYTLSALLFNHLIECIEKSLDPIVAAHAVTVFNALVDIHCKCSDFPSALALALPLPVVAKLDWNMFQSKAVIGKTHRDMVWFLAVENQLRLFVSRVMEHSLELITKWRGEFHITPASLYRNNSSVLPCSCPVSPQLFGDPCDDSRDPVEEAIFSVVSRLTDLLFALPQPVLMFLRAVEESCSETNRQSFALKTIANCLRRAVLDFDRLESTFNCIFTDDVKQRLEIFADSLYHVLLSQSNAKMSSVPDKVAAFLDVHRSWLQEKLEVFTLHLSNDVYKPSKLSPLTGATDDFAQALLQMEIRSISHTKTGVTSLTTVHQFVVERFEWIVSRLNVAPNLPFDDAPDHQMSFQSPASSSDLFKDLGNQLGTTKSNQAVKFDHNWNALLQSDLGIGPAGFRTLLFRRHDMKTGTSIDDGERRLTEALRKKFDMVDSDMESQ